jgi:glycosyltransferase involved in cell wall biosynthesis
VSLLPFYQDGGRCYLPAFDAGSHRAWTDQFATTLLLKPRLVADRVPEGWLPLEGRVEPRPLYERSEHAAPGLLARRRGVRAAVRAAAGDLGLLYLRAPSWECAFGFDAWRGLDVPLLVELHGDWEEAFRAEWEGRRGLSLARHAVAAWARRKTRRMAQEADVLCCVGERLRERYGRGRAACLTTAHLVPEAWFTRREDTCPGGEARLLFVGELVPRKGVSVLVDALARLRAAGHAVSLDVVGDGPLEADLRARAGSAGVAGHVRFAGPVPHGPSLLDYFRRADVFVLPSIAGEGVPRVIQEAMASSCPVVATDVGSVREQLDGGRCGAVVPPRDPDALAAAVARVLEEPAYRRALLRGAFERAAESSAERQRARIRRILEAHVDPALLAPAGAGGAA